MYFNFVKNSTEMIQCYTATFKFTDIFSAQLKNFYQANNVKYIIDRNKKANPAEISLANDGHLSNERQKNW